MEAPISRQLRRRIRRTSKRLLAARSRALRFESLETRRVLAVDVNPGDFDRDYDVDGRDFLLWQRSYGQTAIGEYARVDQDLSGTVDDGDLALWRANYGTTYVPSPNTAPVLDPVADRDMGLTDDTVRIPLEARDDDSDPLTYSAVVTVANPLHEIRETYGLNFANSYFENLTGLNEKWLFGRDQRAFLLLPSGDLIEWLGTYQETASRQSLIARLDASIYADPSKLWNAEQEIAAPATVTIEGEDLIVNPDDGVYGELIVTVAVSDGREVDVERFKIEIDSTYDDNATTRALVATYLAQAESLTHDAIPSFVAELTAQLPSFEGLAAAQLSELLFNLQSSYDAAELAAANGAEWQAEYERLKQEELEGLQYVQGELELLMSEYNAAWEAISNRLETATPQEYGGPPIFVNGADLGTLYVGRGDSLELDFRAIHPSEYVLYSFGETFNYDQNVYGPALSINPQTGKFIWLTPGNASGTYTFKIYAHASNYVDAIATFKVVVKTDNAPTLRALAIDVPAITNTGRDWINLTPVGIGNKPANYDVKVDVYQDTNNNGVLDSPDSRLGYGGIQATHPYKTNASTVTFFAQPYYDTPTATIKGNIVSVTVPVVQTKADVASPVTASGEQNIVYLGDSHGIYDRSKLAILADKKYVFAGRWIPSDPLTMRTIDVSSGVVSNPVNVNGVFDGHFAAAQNGKVVSVYLKNNALWLSTIDLAARTISPAKKIADVPGDPLFDGLVYTVSMNDSGQGVIAWKKYFSTSDDAGVRTFSAFGATLHTTYTVPAVANPGSPGSPWNSIDVSPNGKYAIAGIDNIIFGTVGETQSPKTYPVELNYASDLTINNDGFVVAFGSSIQLISPQGTLLGSPLPVQFSGGAWINSLTFTDYDSVTLYWNRAISISEDELTLYKRTFDFQLQPLLQVTSLAVPQNLSAAATGTLQASVKNAASASSTSARITYYLSHDDRVDLDDRVIATGTFGAIAAGGTAQLSANFTLPPAADPFWRDGVTNLKVIALIANSGKQLSTAIPYVSVVIPPAPIPPGGFDVPPPTEEPEEPDPNVRPKYIRPNIALDQLGGTYVARTIDLMEIVGYQAYAALNSLLAKAPRELKPTIESMAKQMRLRMETFVEQKFAVAFARGEAAQRAEDLRDDAQEAALDDYELKQSAAATERNNVISRNQASIDTSYNSYLRTRSGLDSDYSARITREFHKLDAVDKMIDDHFDNFDFSQTFSSVLKAASDPLKWFRDRADELYALRDQVYEEVTNAVDWLNDEWNDLKDAAWDTYTAARGQFLGAITKAQDAYDKTVTKLQAARDRIIDAAQQVYDDALARIPIDFPENIENVKTAIAPILSTVGGTIQEGLSEITSAGGLLEKVQGDLLNANNFNPHTAVDFLEQAGAAASASAHSALETIQELVKPAFEQIEGSGGKFSDWAQHTGGDTIDWVEDNGQAAVDWVNENVGNILASEVLAYQFKNDLHLDFNLFNGSLFGEVQIIEGVSYDTRKLRESLQGQLALPDLDPLELVPKAFGARLKVTTNYEDVRATQSSQFGASNIYFASSRFAEYAGVETFAEIAAEAILLGGEAADDAMREAAEILRLEVNDILSFLRIKGEAALSSLIPQIYRAVITRTDLVLPQLELRWTPVSYRYDLELDPLLGKAVSLITTGSADSGNTLSELVGDKNLGVSLPHGAFTLVWHDGGSGSVPGPAEINAKLNGAIDLFDSLLLTGSGLDASLAQTIVSALQGSGLPDQLLELTDFVLAQIADVSQMESDFAATLGSQFGISTSVLRNHYVAGSAIIDLTNTAIADQLEAYLNVFAFGNQGSAEIKTLVFDLNKFTVDAEVTIVHKHSWGTIADIVGAAGDVLPLGIAGLQAIEPVTFQSEQNDALNSSINGADANALGIVQNADMSALNHSRYITADIAVEVYLSDCLTSDNELWHADRFGSGSPSFSDKTFDWDEPTRDENETEELALYCLDSALELPLLT